MGEINKESGSLLYNQLAAMLRSDIRSGKYKPSEQIPTEDALCQSYGVSRSTVRKAIAELADEELVERIHGKGTFVSSPKLKTDTPKFLSSTAMILHGGEKLHSKTLSCELVSPTHTDEEFFGEDCGKLIAVRRVRGIKDVPICIETILFTSKYFFLTSEDFDGSFYEMLGRHGISPCGGYSSFEICSATDEEASLLQVKKAEPLLLIKDYVYDQDGNPLHISKRIHIGSTIKYGIQSVSYQIPDTM